MLGWLTTVTKGVFLEVLVYWLSLSVLISELGVRQTTQVRQLERSILGFPHRSEIGFQTNIPENGQELF